MKGGRAREDSARPKRRASAGSATASAPTSRAKIVTALEPEAPVTKETPPLPPSDGRGGAGEGPASAASWRRTTLRSDAVPSASIRLSEVPAPAGPPSSTARPETSSSQAPVASGVCATSADGCAGPSASGPASSGACARAVCSGPSTLVGVGCTCGHEAVPATTPSPAPRKLGALAAYRGCRPVSALRSARASAADAVGELVSNGVAASVTAVVSPASATPRSEAASRAEPASTFDPGPPVNGTSRSDGTTGEVEVARATLSSATPALASSIVAVAETEATGAWAGGFGSASACTAMLALPPDPSTVAAALAATLDEALEALESISTEVAGDDVSVAADVSAPPDVVDDDATGMLASLDVARVADEGETALVSTPADAAASGLASATAGLDVVAAA